MSTVEHTPDEVSFLSRFFGPGNLLRWDAYVSGEMAESSRDLLTPLIEDFRNEDVPVLLPCVSESTPTTIDWYAMARDARESQALREQLAAFIGPTHTDFTGQYATIDVTDSVEGAVSERFSPHVFRLRVINNDDREKVRNQVFLMRSFRDRHPDRTTRIVRPVGRLLRDLEMALVVCNEDSAWRCLDDLRSRGRLSAHNLTFLKVRILANFERWHDLLSLPESTSLVTIHRPARVTQALVQAIYAVHLVKFDESTDVRGCIERFRDLGPSFGTLFRARGELHDLTVLKAFLGRTVAEQPVRLEAVKAIVDEFPANHHSRPWVEALSAFARSQVDSRPLTDTSTETQRFDAARSACELGDYDVAFALLLECAPSPGVIRQLLACSFEIDSLAAARGTLSFIEHCPDDVRDTALSMRAYRQIWDALTQQIVPVEPKAAAETIPDGWIPWIERLNEQGAWSNAAGIARHGSLEWSCDEFRTAPTLVSRFAELLVSTRPPDGDSVLRNAVPELLTAFLPEGVAVREFKPIYLNLGYLLALDDAIGHDDLAALASLAEAILECAPVRSAQSETNEFEELLETLEAAWNHIAAPRHIDWALNVLDLLIAFNVRQHAPVDRFLHQIVNGFREWSRRIRRDQWELIEQLSEDLGQSELLVGVRPVNEESAEDSLSLVDQLSGQTVAIYTLTERIGCRASEVINNRFKGVKVQLIHDKESTDRLEQLARNADVFIVNTWDAKHAATNAIDQHRSNEHTTLYPASKSAGSIIRALYTFLES